MSLARTARGLLTRPIHKPNLVKLQCESLEDRTVPTPLAGCWIGDVSADPTNPYNWYPTIVPAPGSDLYFYGSEMTPFAHDPVTGLPRSHGGPCDKLQGDWGHVFVGLGYDNTISVSGETTFDFLEIKSGTVSLLTGTQADIFHLKGGDLLQDEAADMTVNVQFVWTEGDINAAGEAANLNITGASASIEPVDAGTVALGSTLNVDSEAFVGIEPGTVDVVGGDGFFVENATVQAKSKNENAYAKIHNEAPGDNRFVIGKSAYYHVVRESTDKPGLHHTSLPIEVTDGGKFEIDGAIDVTVTGQLGGNGPSVSSKGTVHITGGSVLRVPNGISLTGGTLQTFHPPAPTSKAIIVGNVVIDGATVRREPEESWYGILRVEGDVTWSSGTYRVGVPAAGNPTTTDRCIKAVELS